MGALKTLMHSFLCWAVSKETRKYFILLLCINTAGYLSILRSDFLYRDDVRRVINNYEEWEKSGRFVSYLFSKVFFFGMNADASPFTQLLAIAIASFSCLVILFIFFRDKPWLLLFFSPFCLSPYTLQCFSYKFDAPWFAFSILTSCAPFVFILQNNKKIQLFSTTIFLFLTLNTYQPSIGIFLIILFYSTIYDTRAQKTFKDTLEKYTPNIAGIFIAILIYYLQIKFITPITTDWGNEHSRMVFSEKKSLLLFWNNIQSYIKYISFDWNESLFEYIFILNLYIILLFSLKKAFQNSSRLFALKRTLFFLILAILLFFSPYSLQFFLAAPVWHPRTFIPLGCLVSFIMIDAITLLPRGSLYKKIMIGLNIYCIFQFIVIGNIYGNLLSSQAAYENNLLPSLTTDLQTLRRQYICQKISFRNDIGYSPAFENIARRYPVMYKLIYPRIGNNAHIQDLLKYYGVIIPNIPPRYFKDSPLAMERPKYQITIAPDKTCVVFFK